MATRDPEDERIATLEKQVAELVDAIVKLAGEGPLLVPCQLPHYPPAPVVPYYPPVVATPNTTSGAPYTYEGPPAPVYWGAGTDSVSVTVSGMSSEPFCHLVA